MHDILADVRRAFRSSVRAPGFTSLAWLTLGLGIGANTAIFSIVDAALLRPLPYRDPTRLVTVWEAGLAGGSGTGDSVAPPNFLDWREQSGSFEHLAALTGTSVNLAGDGDPERLDGHKVTADFFGVMGVRPAIGRAFTEEEDRVGGPRAVVVGHGLWTRRYGADPDLVGRTVRLDGEPHTVVGVMPPGFYFRDRSVEVWLPMAFTEAQRSARGAHFITVLGRLRADVTLEAARAEMDAIAAGLADAHPRFNEGLGAAVVPLSEASIGSLRPTLLMLAGAVAFVLLIACTNLANMLLARSALRRRDVAVRHALGASRWRILRQLLVEGAWLATGGVVVGVIFAIWGLDALLALAPSTVGRLQDAAIDGRVLAFTASLGLGTAVVCGLVPALDVTPDRTFAALREATHRSTGRSGRRLRNALVVIEVALAVVLLVGAGLLVNSLMRLQAVNPGFAPASVLTARIDLAGPAYAEPIRRQQFSDALLDRVGALPGVQHAGFVTMLPLDGDGITLGLTIEGRPLADGPGDSTFAAYRVITPDYFQVMGIPMRRGRAFSALDTDASGDVVVISETMARQFWPGSDPIGQRLMLGRGPGPWKEVVGIVGDVRMSELRRAPTPTMYVPLAQPHPAFAAPRLLVVRSVGDPASLVDPIRAAVASIDPTQPVSRVRRMGDIVSESLAQPRLYASLLSTFGLLALALSALGVYGVISCAVAQRTPEIGLRLALGADRRDIFRMVASQGLGLSIIGLGLGLLGALGLTRILSSLLFGVTPADPVTLAIVALLLMLAAGAASWAPARRATRVDPMISLRAE